MSKEIECFFLSPFMKLPSDCKAIIQRLETFLYFQIENFIIIINWLPETQNVSKYTVKRPNFVSCTFLCPILGIFVTSIINKLQVFTVGNQILRSFERWNPMKKIEKTTKCQSQVSVLNFDEQKFNLPIN